MKFHPDIPVYGDQKWRGDCPREQLEMATFFGWLRGNMPEMARIAIHPKNEGQLRGGQFSALATDKTQGMVKGAADIIIPGAPSFVCEMKRKDHTKGAFEEGQMEYLLAAQSCGAFVCVGLGWEGAALAVQAWRQHARKYRP